MPKFDQNAEAPTYELLTGDYPFEISTVVNKISKGAKTAGCDTREVELNFYRDDSFAEKVATVKDTLYDSPACDWKYSVLARCVKYPVNHGDAVDVDNCWRGYRGWAHLSPEPSKTEPGKSFNRVRAYLTDRKPIAPRVIAADETDDTPF